MLYYCVGKEIIELNESFGVDAMRAESVAAALEGAAIIIGGKLQHLNSAVITSSRCRGLCEGKEGGEEVRREWWRPLLKDAVKFVRNGGVGSCREGGDGNKW